MFGHLGSEKLLQTLLMFVLLAKHARHSSALASTLGLTSPFGDYLCFAVDRSYEGLPKAINNPLGLTSPQI